jgi:hypothetical protein
MPTKILLGITATMVGVFVAAATLRPQTVPAAERVSLSEEKTADGGKQDSIGVDVVIDEVDLSAGTISATSTVHVIPPHDNVGEQVLVIGTTGSHMDKATKYLRLPVMPEAKLKQMKPSAGMHAMLRLKMLPQGALAVVGIEEFTGVERIGIEWLDAPGTIEGQ